MSIAVNKRLFRALLANCLTKRLIDAKHRPLSTVTRLRVIGSLRDQSITSSVHKQIVRQLHRSVTTMNDDRGIADGAEQLAANPSLASGIASVQVGVGTVSDAPAGRSAKHWSPDPEMMSALMAMGISAVAAKKALFYTNNHCIESATNWIFENPDRDLDTPLELEVNIGAQSNVGAQGGESAFENANNEVYKMVFVVNSSLEMGVGKIAAQVAHAALGMHQILLQDESKFGESLIRWFEFGETKIVLKGETTQHLIELEKKALELGLPTYLVQDAGKTQVKSGSTTVLCVYGQTDRVDEVTGRLRLL